MVINTHKYNTRLSSGKLKRKVIVEFSSSDDDDDGSSSEYVKKIFYNQFSCHFFF